MDRIRLAGTNSPTRSGEIRALARPLHLSPTEAEISTFERLIDKAREMFDLLVGPMYHKNREELIQRVAAPWGSGEP